MEPLYGRRSTDVGDVRDSANQETADIAIDLMGGLRVRTGGATLGPRNLGGTKQRLVLLALLLYRGSPVSKDRLVALLWGMTPPKGASATLESYVCHLRKRLQPDQQSRSSVIKTQAGCYRIDLSRVDLDVVRYEKLMSAALRPEVPASYALPLLERAISLAVAPLLPEETDHGWMDELRATHTHKVCENLVAAARKVAATRPDSAQQWARLALERDPLDESAWYVLLNSMEISGHHAQGLREYDTCRKLLAVELGCAPGSSLQDLYVRLLHGANEDNQQLGQLFDAVIRLHDASQLGSPHTASPLSSQRHHASDQDTSVSQAHRTLDRLMSRISGFGQDLGLAQEA